MRYSAWLSSRTSGGNSSERHDGTQQLDPATRELAGYSWNAAGASLKVVQLLAGRCAKRGDIDYLCIQEIQHEADVVQNFTTDEGDIIIISKKVVGRKSNVIVIARGEYAILARPH
jgi:hypothetical protein